MTSCIISLRRCLDAASLGAELLAQADRLVGGDDAVLVLDGSALPKKGWNPVGVAALYSVLTADKRKAHCFYEAPSADVVRVAARRSSVVRPQSLPNCAQTHTFCGASVVI
jgi:SRSO17 transposase